MNVLEQAVEETATQTEEKPIVETTEETQETSEVTTEKTQETTQEEGSIWNDVNALTGTVVEGDFENSPEGAAKYVETFVQVKLKEFEQNLKKDYPDAYELMLFLQAGGKKEEFFEVLNTPDYSKITLEEKNEVMLEKIIREDLKQKGLSDKKIDNYINVSKTNGTLVEDGKESLESLKALEVKKKEGLQKIATERKEKTERVISTTFNAYDKVVEAGKIGDYVIPTADRKAFSEFVKQSTFYDDEQNVVFLQIPIDPNNMASELLTEFFRFKGGKVDALIKQAGSTAATKTIIRKIKNESKGAETSGTQQQLEKKEPKTLSDIWERK